MKHNDEPSPSGPIVGPAEGRAKSAISGANGALEAEDLEDLRALTARPTNDSRSDAAGELAAFDGGLFDPTPTLARACYRPPANDSPAPPEAPPRAPPRRAVWGLLAVGALGALWVLGSPGGSKREDAPPKVAFDEHAAQRSIHAAAARASTCLSVGSGERAAVKITFEPSGRAGGVEIAGSFGATAAGACVRAALEGATVPPFDGEAVTLAGSVPPR